MDTAPPIFQRFENCEGPLQSLPTYISEEHGDRYVLWSDIQHAFKGVDLWRFVEWNDGLKVLFVVDGDTVRELIEEQRKFEDEQEDQAEESLQIELTWAKTPSDSAGRHVEASQGCTRESPDNECALHLRDLLKSLKILNEELTEAFAYNQRPSSYERQPREIFQKLAANTRYFYSMTLRELERLEALGMKVKVDGLAEEELYTYLHDMHHETVMAEYRNNCFSSLWSGVFGEDYYYPAPRLFIVLPADLDIWIDSDMATHSFRLFFMCENKKQECEAPEDMPQHIHLSNHPGYNLQRPQEFFQIYGDYVLRMLQMVEYGYSDCHVVPPLNSFKILRDHDPVIAGSHLSKETIGALVAKSIAYIKNLSPSKWIKDPMLSASQSAKIEAYLEIPDNCNGQGN
ncbi:hypothetical protein BGZ93_010267, partial [Podila epicladia]